MNCTLLALICDISVEPLHKHHLRRLQKEVKVQLVEFLQLDDFACGGRGEERNGARKEGITKDPEEDEVRGIMFSNLRLSSCPNITRIDLKIELTRNSFRIVSAPESVVPLLVVEKYCEKCSKFETGLKTT